MKCLRRLLKSKLRLKIKKSENSEVHKIDFVRGCLFLICLYFNCHPKNRIAEMAERSRALIECGSIILLEALGSIPIGFFFFFFLLVL